MIDYVKINSKCNVSGYLASRIVNLVDNFISLPPHSFPSLLNDMTIVNRVLDLPTLEPMTATHLEKVATVIMSCLYAAIAAAVASSIMSTGGSHVRTGSESRVGSITTMKEEELESICNSVVLKGVSIVSLLSLHIYSPVTSSI